MLTDLNILTAHNRNLRPLVSLEIQRRLMNRTGLIQAPDYKPSVVAVTEHPLVNIEILSNAPIGSEPFGAAVSHEESMLVRWGHPPNPFE